MFDAPLENCPLCGSGRLRPYAVDFQERRIHRCADCRIRFLNPQYSEAYLRKLYNHYPGIRFPGEEKSTPMDREMRESAHRHYLSLVERFSGPGRFLAVGCGDGLEMRMARERGWSVTGCDVDEESIANGEREGFEMFRGALEDLPSGSGRYDCIYLHHVLEHPKNPRTYLRKAATLLNPAGVLFIASPNLGSLSSRLKTFLSRAGVSRRPLKHFDTWHHLFYFTPAALARLLEARYGYRVLLTHCGLDDRHHPRNVSNRFVRRYPNLTLLKSKFVLLCTPRAAGTG